MKKNITSLASQGATFIRNSSGDENNHFCGSYWQLDGKIIQCEGQKLSSNSINPAIKQMGEYERGQISDGYHNFDELYEHRTLLFQALCNLMPNNCYKTEKNFQKESYDGWFILVMNHPIVGQISYHLPKKLWNNCRVRIESYCHDYDGHTSTDTLNRLSQL